MGELLGRNGRAHRPPRLLAPPSPLVLRFGGLPPRTQGAAPRWPSTTNAFMLFYDRVATLEALPTPPFAPAPASAAAAAAGPAPGPAPSPASSLRAHPFALALQQLALSPSTPLPVLLPADVAARVMASNEASLRALLTGETEGGRFLCAALRGAARAMDVAARHGAARAAHAHALLRTPQPGPSAAPLLTGPPLPPMLPLPLSLPVARGLARLAMLGAQAEALCAQLIGGTVRRPASDFGQQGANFTPPPGQTAQILLLVRALMCAAGAEAGGRGDIGAFGARARSTLLGSSTAVPWSGLLLSLSASYRGHRNRDPLPALTPPPMPSVGEAASSTDEALVEIEVSDAEARSMLLISEPPPGSDFAAAPARLAVQHAPAAGACARTASGAHARVRVPLLSGLPGSGDEGATDGLRIGMLESLARALSHPALDLFADHCAILGGQGGSGGRGDGSGSGVSADAQRSAPAPRLQYLIMPLVAESATMRKAAAARASAAAAATSASSAPDSAAATNDARAATSAEPQPLSPAPPAAPSPPPPQPPPFPSFREWAPRVLLLAPGPREVRPTCALFALAYGGLGASNGYVGPAAALPLPAADGAAARSALRAILPSLMRALSSVAEPLFLAVDSHSQAEARALARGSDRDSTIMRDADPFRVLDALLPPPQLCGARRLGRKHAAFEAELRARVAGGGAAAVGAGAGAAASASVPAVRPAAAPQPRFAASPLSPPLLPPPGLPVRAALLAAAASARPPLSRAAVQRGLRALRALDLLGRVFVPFISLAAAHPHCFVEFLELVETCVREHPLAHFALCRNQLPEWLLQVAAHLDAKRWGGGVQSGASGGSLLFASSELSGAGARAQSPAESRAEAEAEQRACETEAAACLARGDAVGAELAAERSLLLEAEDFPRSLGARVLTESSRALAPGAKWLSAAPPSGLNGVIGAMEDLTLRSSEQATPADLSAAVEREIGKGMGVVGDANASLGIGGAGPARTPRSAGRGRDGVGAGAGAGGLEHLSTAATIVQSQSEAVEKDAAVRLVALFVGAAADDGRRNTPLDGQLEVDRLARCIAVVLRGCALDDLYPHEQDGLARPPYFAPRENAGAGDMRREREAEAPTPRISPFALFPGCAQFRLSSPACRRLLLGPGLVWAHLHECESPEGQRHAGVDLTRLHAVLPLFQHLSFARPHYSASICSALTAALEKRSLL